MSRLVIYHDGCADGFGAAWVCHVLFEDPTTTYLPAKYGDRPPNVKGLDVIIVDFSYPRVVLEQLHAEANSLLVLDHHQTAQADLAGLDYAVFDMTRSGAALAWDYFHSFRVGVRPPLVDYVQDRDLWRWRLQWSREVSAWLATVPKTFKDWGAANVMLCNSLGFVDFAGKALLRAQDQVKAAKRARLVWAADGSEVPCVNASDVDLSELLNRLAQDKPFAIGWWQREDGMFVYSLRSVGDYDVSAYAKRFGGGGHKHAAGFTADKLLF